MTKSNKEKDQDKEGGILGDTLKKVLSVGVGAAFMTEDVVKNILNDLPLSKEVITGLIQNAKKSKEEFIRSVRDELVKHLKSVDPKNVIEEVLENYDININAQVKFSRKKPKDDDPS